MGSHDSEFHAGCDNKTSGTVIDIYGGWVGKQLPGECCGLLLLCL